jgi:hypothetical protein
MPHCWSSNSFFRVDIPLCHYFKKEIEDLTIESWTITREVMMVCRISWDHIYYTLFCICITLLSLLPSIETCVIMLNQNHLLESNRHMLEFLHPFLLCKITYWALLDMFLGRILCANLFTKFFNTFIKGKSCT